MNAQPFLAPQVQSPSFHVTGGSALVRDPFRHKS